MDEREKLMERYDDAAFALMMDECAENEGAAFLAEFQAAAQAGELPELPEDIDRLCRDAIKREYAGRERKVRFRQFKRAAARVAVAVFAVIGLLGTLVMSVEAIRIPLVGFIVEHFERFTTISPQDTKEKDVVEDPYEALEDILPIGYEEIIRSGNASVTFALYENENGETVSLDIISAGAEMVVDTEDAGYSEINLSGYSAILLEKNGYSVIWADDDSVRYVFYASNLSEKQVIEICGVLALWMQNGG